jgi:hypothetical protein
MIEIISLAWRVDIQGILVFWLHIKMVDNWFWTVLQKTASVNSFAWRATNQRTQVKDKKAHSNITIKYSVYGLKLLEQSI